MSWPCPKKNVRPSKVTAHFWIATDFKFLHWLLQISSRTVRISLSYNFYNYETRFYEAQKFGWKVAHIWWLKWLLSSHVDVCQVMAVSWLLLHTPSDWRPHDVKEGCVILSPVLPEYLCVPREKWKKMVKKPVVRAICYLLIFIIWGLALCGACLQVLMTTRRFYYKCKNTPEGRQVRLLFFTDLIQSSGSSDRT